MRLAFFVSPHGLGHAGRACAVMEALHHIDASIRFDVFTTVPEWFFQETMDGLFDYHVCESDVGFRHVTALEIDVRATREAVESFVVAAADEADTLATEVQRLGCAAIVCDISPLGIMVAERAGLPSVLVESFTWDWLYEPLARQEPGFEALTDWMQARFSEAGLRVHARPACDPEAHVDLAVEPISRAPRRSRAEVRAELGIGVDQPTVLLTMGGVDQPLPFLADLERRAETTFVVTGADRTQRDGNLRLFSNDTRIFLPDLVRAADAVVAKLGYSTLAEVWAAGRPLAYVARPDFRESGPLEAFVREEIPSLPLANDEFISGAWADRVGDLLTLSPAPARAEGGAGATARLILDAV